MQSKKSSGFFFIVFYFIAGIFGSVLFHPDPFQYSVVLRGYWMHSVVYLSGNVVLIDLLKALKWKCVFNPQKKVGTGLNAGGGMKGSLRVINTPMGLAPQPEVFSFFRSAIKWREKAPPSVASEDKPVFETHAWVCAGSRAFGRVLAAACNLTLVVLSRD